MPPNGIGNDDDDGLSLVRSAHRRDEGEACAPPLVDDDEDDGGGGTTVGGFSNCFSLFCMLDV